jgi:uncharacterized protein (DUF1015 family)
MIVKPFRGLRPRSDLAAKIPSYPYDVVDRDEARRLAGDDPYSFLHVVRAEIDLEPEVGPYDEQVYDRARHNFRTMIESGWLVRDDEPAYYVYRLRMDDHVQTGIIGAAAVDDYLDDRIKKHEHTRPDKENDRVRVIQALGAHPGPVFLTHPADAGLASAVHGVVETEPAVRFTASDGIEHALWVVDDATTRAGIERRFGQVPATYVADGHHRTAAAARACEGLRGGLKAASGSESCNFFLAVHFPSDQVRVLDYNRVVRDLNGLTPESFLEQVRSAGFEITPGHAAKRPARRSTFGMYLGGSWYLLGAGPEIVPTDDMLGRLDVSVLSDRVLGPILGVEDPRTDRRIDFVGGIRGMEELERRVDAGDGAVAFALYPTSVEDLMRVADAGQVMPPKSTWFEPKLRSGMVVQFLDTDPL